MNTSKLIRLEELCTHYRIKISFFNNLDEIGLIEIKTIEQTLYIHRDNLNTVEKILRLHHELNVNIEGIDVIFNLLQMLEKKETELSKLKNRLRIYEN